MRVGVLRAELHVSEAQNLKQKRHIVLSLKDRLASRFNCAVSEVGGQDLWQRSELGVAIVSLGAKDADAKLRKIEQFMRSHPGATLLRVEREIIQF